MLLTFEVLKNKSCILLHNVEKVPVSCLEGEGGRRQRMNGGHADCQVM